MQKIGEIINIANKVFVKNIKKQIKKIKNSQYRDEVKNNLSMAGELLIDSIYMFNKKKTIAAISILRNVYEMTLKGIVLDKNEEIFNSYQIIKKSGKLDKDNSSKIRKFIGENFKEYFYVLENDESFNNIDVYVNSNYDLYINDIKVSDEDLISKEEIKEYSEVYDKVDLPYENHYKITNLTKKPKIKVMSGNDEVKVTSEKSTYYGVSYFKTDDKDAAFAKLTNKDYDPLTFAKNWSLFLTADLSGERYGLYTLTPNLVQGTALYKRAYSWATNVDITFTSMHTLDKDTFTNVKMNGFTVYNENAFSVDIYLEKNMTLVNGEKRVDTLNDTFYYAYIDGAYRLITMKSKGDN